MDVRVVCLLVLLFLCGKLISSHGQEPQPHPNEGLASLFTDDCLWWKELDLDAELCVRLCEDSDRHDKTFCRALENCCCEPTGGQQLVGRKNENSSEEIKYGWQEQEPRRGMRSRLVALFDRLLNTIFSGLFSIISSPLRFLWYLLSQLVALFVWLPKAIFSVLFSIISFPFRFLWYLLSRLVALFVWSLKTIFSVLFAIISFPFRLLAWLFWLLKVLAYALMLYLGSIAGLQLFWYLLPASVKDIK